MTKHAFITGAAKRVGRALALSLARQGYNITIHYHTSHDEAQALCEEIEALGRQCCTVRADLGQHEQVQGLIEQSVDTLGTVTLLIHNASLFEKDNLKTATPESLEAHMRINMFAPIWLTQAFMAHLPDTVEGHIICLLDGMKGWSISPQFMSYSLSKTGLEQFIQLQATTLAPYARINGIALGATLEGHMDKPTTFDKIRSITPLEHISSIKEVETALHALLDMPSVTGQIVKLSGGLHLHH